MDVGVLSFVVVVLVAFGRTPRRRVVVRRVRLLSATPSTAWGRRRAFTRVVAVVLIILGLGPVFGVFIIVLAQFARVVRRVVGQRRSRMAMEADVPDLLELLVAIIRAGHHPIGAFEIAAELAPASLASACSEVVTRNRLGERFADCLTSLPEPLAPCARLFARSDRYSEPLAPLLDRLADDARSARRRQSEASARRLPVRLCFPLATCTLPSFVVLTIVPLLAGAVSSLRLSI